MPRAPDTGWPPRRTRAVPFLPLPVVRRTNAILPECPRNVAGKTFKRVMRDEYWKDRAVKI